MMEIQDLITVSNSVAKDPLTSTVYKQYIEERVFDKIVKNDEIWSKNLLKNTNNQILRDFIDKKNFHLLKKIEVVSCVTINTERNNLDELSKELKKEIIDLVKILLEKVNESTKIVEFFKKEDEVKRIKLEIRRSIISSSFDDEKIRKIITDEFIELAKVHFK